VEFNLKSGQRWWILIIAGVLGLVIIVGAGYLIWNAFQVKEPEPQETKVPELPRMANLPPKKTSIPPPPPPSYSPDAPVLEKVRKALREGITPEEALAMAKSLPESPERADAAFLLLEYAADSGNAESALTAPSGTIRKSPETAYGWYRDALKGGQENAKDSLAQLHSWVEKQASDGSSEARELLNNWR